MNDEHEILTSFREIVKSGVEKTLSGVSQGIPFNKSFPEEKIPYNLEVQNILLSENFIEKFHPEKSSELNKVATFMNQFVSGEYARHLIKINQECRVYAYKSFYLAEKAHNLAAYQKNVPESIIEKNKEEGKHALIELLNIPLVSKNLEDLISNLSKIETDYLWEEISKSNERFYIKKPIGHSG